MTPLASLLVLASSLMWMSAEGSILCVWTRALPGGEVHSSFLRRSSVSLRLYHSVWSRERALQECAWSEQTSVVDRYLSACRAGSRDFTDDLRDKLELDSVSEADCDSVDSVDPPGAGTIGWHGHRKRSVRSAGDTPPAENSPEVTGHSRRKRGFIVPGTLWCGSGNRALSFSDLGVFADTDSCCREHDQCKHTILSFQSQFGVFNRNIFTMSHCDCDNKFRQCLREANDSISDVVGYTFFNLLKMHCFEFSHQLQCTQWNWFGMCKETKLALYAEVHPPTLYESTNPTEPTVVDSSLLNTTPPTEPTQSPTVDPRLLPTAAATVSTVSMTLTAAPSFDTDAQMTKSLPGTQKTETNAGIKELRRSCSIYKGLDECTDRILPQQTKYGLHNPENRTIYHCNCTARLFQTLVKQRQLTKVQAHLFAYVSPSCFLPQDCTSDAMCTATLVRPDLPQLSRRNDTGMDELRPPVALTTQDRRPTSRRTRRKGRGMKLHRLCLRMLWPSGKSPSV